MPNATPRAAYGISYAPCNFRIKPLKMEHFRFCDSDGRPRLVSSLPVFAHARPQEVTARAPSGPPSSLAWSVGHGFRKDCWRCAEFPGNFRLDFRAVKLSPTLIEQIKYRHSRGQSDASIVYWLRTLNPPIEVTRIAVLKARNRQPRPGAIPRTG